MRKQNFVFSSESVGEGHPDKICDQVSDAILDACFQQDLESRIACETLAKNDCIILAGEITTRAHIDYPKLVRSVIHTIGYTDPKLGFSADTCEIHIHLNEQSPDISQGVTEGEGAHKAQGAGDQGLMFGFACRETEELMPLPIALSHKLMLELNKDRKEHKAPFLRPDGKAQVSVKYENGQPAQVETIVVSNQHTEEVSSEEVERYIIDKVVSRVVPEHLLTANTRYFINPTGRFVVGGPVGDCGLTGRKIIVDTYGGYGRHGGGAFSGKDPSKVDRSAAYAARYIAKNVVAAGLAERCEVQIAYAIGVAEPVSVLVDTLESNTVPEERIEKAILQTFDLTPRGIIELLSLRKPIYRPTATYGHFGRLPSAEGHFSWERTDKVAELQRLAS